MKQSTTLTLVLFVLILTVSSVLVFKQDVKPKPKPSYSSYRANIPRVVERLHEIEDVPRVVERLHEIEDVPRVVERYVMNTGHGGMRPNRMSGRPIVGTKRR